MSVKNPAKRRVFAASELSEIHGNGFESSFVVRVMSCHVTADTQIPENAGHARAVISLQLYHQGTSCCPPSRISGAPVSDRPTNVPGPVC